MLIARIPHRRGRIAAYLLAGLYGLAFFAIGAIWLATGQRIATNDFPTTPAEGLAALAGGLAVAIWAVVRSRREIEQRRPGKDESVQSEE